MHNIPVRLVRTFIDLENAVLKLEIPYADETEISITPLTQVTLPAQIGGISLSAAKATLSRNESLTLSAVVTSSSASDENVIWSSSDCAVATVENGVVTAIAPGMAVIIAETEDQGYKDFCVVQVSAVTARNGAQIENGIVSGLSTGLCNLNEYLALEDNSMNLEYSAGTIGTGTRINVTQGDVVINAYEAKIFGDVNGDGLCDGEDSFIVSCLANGLLTREQVGEAKYSAADCNRDGLVNDADAELLNSAGVLLAQINQSAIG